MKRVNREYTTRFMGSNSSQRSLPYLRSSIDKIGTLDSNGKPSSVPIDTHITVPIETMAVTAIVIITGYYTVYKK